MSRPLVKTQMLTAYHINIHPAGQVEVVIPKRMKTTIMACALSLNVCGYVAAKVLNLYSQDAQAARTASTIMLRNQLKAIRLNAREGYSFISVRMASVFLAFGGDLIYRDNKYSEMTTWEKFLGETFGSAGNIPSLTIPTSQTW